MQLNKGKEEEEDEEKPVNPHDVAELHSTLLCMIRNRYLRWSLFVGQLQSGVGVVWRDV